MCPQHDAAGATAPHVPVMLHEVLDYLAVRPGGRYLDCTVGAGGHARAILAAAGPDGRLLGLDADPDAIAIAGETLRPYGERAVLVQGYFDHVAEIAARAGFVPADGMLCDLGPSSMQFDRPERGFSFQAAGPLDMRFGPEAETTAAEIVNTYSVEDLADLLYRFGDERRSRRIARALVQRRPIASTLDLAKAVEQAVGRGWISNRSRVHPATKTFLALRIAVNQELRRLTTVLAVARGLLGFGSRLVILSFHSLEDRVVKRFMQEAARDRAPTFRILTRKVVRPSVAEVRRNPRSRSARLRAAEAI